MAGLHRRRGGPNRVGLVRLAVSMVAAGWAGLTVVGSLVAACSSPAALLGQGGQCLQTTDCQAGLFCVPGKNGAAKTCSNNLASTVSTEEAGAPAATDAAAGDAAPGDGSAPPATDGEAPEDTGPLRDTGTVSKPDASELMEAASPMPEASPPEASPPDDAPSE